MSIFFIILTILVYLLGLMIIWRNSEKEVKRFKKYSAALEDEIKTLREMDKLLSNSAAYL